VYIGWCETLANEPMALDRYQPSCFEDFAGRQESGARGQSQRHWRKRRSRPIKTWLFSFVQIWRLLRMPSIEHVAYPI